LTGYSIEIHGGPAIGNTGAEWTTAALVPASTSPRVSDGTIEYELRVRNMTILL
jgi:hypothetical protein